MAWTVGPTFAQTDNYSGLTYSLQAVRGVVQLPLYVAQYPQLEGEILEFAAAAESHFLPVPIPRLAGLDDIEVEQVSFDLSSARHEDEKSVSGPGAGRSEVTINYTPQGENVVSRLTQIEVQDLRLDADAANSYVLDALTDFGGSDRQVVYAWDAGQNRSVAHVNGSTGNAHFVHFLVRPKVGGAFGPPMAAVPYFEMPGAGKAMYGPALGGAVLSLYHDGDNKIRALLKFNPPLQTGTVKLLLGKTSSARDGPHAGLPNEIQGVNWRAATVVASYDIRPAGVSVNSTVPDDPNEPVVARFDTDPGDAPVNIEFASVARSMLRTNYPSSSGDDLGLRLKFTCDTPGKLRVNLTQASARYLRYPLADESISLHVQGAAESMNLAVPEDLRPAGVSFTLDGVYGPARLVAAADNTPAAARHGFRVAGNVQLARRISLTEREQNLPLIRVALFGRAGEAGELLISIHRGDATRIGPAIGPPYSLALEPASGVAWHRISFASDDLLPPQPEALWVVARATDGIFWWHATGESDVAVQRSTDDGAGWNAVTQHPLLQLAVLEGRLDPASREVHPEPLMPLQLSWVDGVLNSDLVGVSGQATTLPPTFRRFWMAQSSAHAPFLNRIPSLGGLLRLDFDCRRDVEMTVRDVALVYNPWDTGDA